MNNKTGWEPIQRPFGYYYSPGAYNIGLKLGQGTRKGIKSGVKGLRKGIKAGGKELKGLLEYMAGTGKMSVGDYKVQPGDTLSGIAARTEQDWKDIAKANKFSTISSAGDTFYPEIPMMARLLGYRDPKTLQAGETLKGVQQAPRSLAGDLFNLLGKIDIGGDRAEMDRLRAEYYNIGESGKQFLPEGQGWFPGKILGGAAGAGIKNYFKNLKRNTQVNRITQQLQQTTSSPQTTNIPQTTMAPQVTEKVTKAVEVLQNPKSSETEKETAVKKVIEAGVYTPEDIQYILSKGEEETMKIPSTIFGRLVGGVVTNIRRPHGYEDQGKFANEPVSLLGKIRAALKDEPTYTIDPEEKGGWTNVAGEELYRQTFGLKPRGEGKDLYIKDKKTGSLTLNPDHPMAQEMQYVVSQGFSKARESGKLYKHPDLPQDDPRRFYKHKVDVLGDVYYDKHGNVIDLYNFGLDPGEKRLTKTNLLRSFVSPVSSPVTFTGAANVQYPGRIKPFGG